MKIAVNGKLCDERDAVVSAYDHGFMYGIGLFETLRTYGGEPFLLGAHLRRLAQGCEALDIAYAPDEAALRETFRALLAANGLADAYFRLSVSAGPDALGLPTGRYLTPTVIIYVKPLPTAAPGGKALQLLTLRRNSPEGDVRLKSFHYMNNILGKIELKRYPWASGAEGLFLDAAGRVAEGIVSNVFFAGADGVLRTPALATGALPGITRGHVLRLADRLGLRAEEGLYGFGELTAAREAFVTNSIQEIVPVRAVYEQDGTCHSFGDGGPGELTRRLIAVYRIEAGPAEEEEGR